MRKQPETTLRVRATWANVRQVEPNGAVLNNVEFVGKRFVPDVDPTAQGQFEIIPEGVVLRLRGKALQHINKAIERGDLILLGAK